MFDTLTERLSQSLRNVTGRGRITEDNIRGTVREIRMALLEADVALPVAKAFVARVRERALGQEVARSLNPGQTFTKIVNDELVNVLGNEPSRLASRGVPSIVMLVGLQGAGKTTTAAKLARFCRGKSNDSVLLASTDVYRPAAREQLAKLAALIGADYFASDLADPRAIAEAALLHARRAGSRWLIVDTAGRLHVDEAMMDEARAVADAIEPAETLFVVDSMGGQDALNSARAFHEALPLTGIVLTKADGDARGGVALSVRESTGLPIKFLGMGEKLDALEAFVPERFASRILGMGDVVGLVEQVHEQIDAQKLERVATKLKRGKSLNLEDLREQLDQIANMGGLGSILDKLPGAARPAGLGAADIDTRAIKRQIAIIDSMTPKERRQPDVVNGSRKRRIAAGSGQSIQDVNRLLKQHKLMAKTMKRAKRAGGLQNLLGALSGPRGPRPPR